jgi:integrase
LLAEASTIGSAVMLLCLSSADRRVLESYRADLRLSVPVDARCRDRAAGGDAGPPGAVPHIDGAARVGGVDDRPAVVDDVGLLAFRAHRRPHPSQPAQHVRRPRVHPSVRRGMDRDELARFLYTAERVSATHAALAVLLGLNGLRVSEACATNIENLGAERGHRILEIVGKGDKPAAIPLVPRTARTISLAIGERASGPILLRADGQRLDSRTAYRWVRSIGRRAGLDRVHPHMLRAAFIMAALDAGVPLRDVQLAARHADPRTTTIYDRRRENFDRHAAYAVVAYVTSG